eukprot:9201090-Pyramimonas_sp.AAC.1
MGWASGARETWFWGSGLLETGSLGERSWIAGPALGLFFAGVSRISSASWGVLDRVGIFCGRLGFFGESAGPS